MIKKVIHFMNGLPKGRRQWFVPVSGFFIAAPFLFSASWFEKNGYPMLLVFAIGFLGMGLYGVWFSAFINHEECKDDYQKNKK